MLAFNNIIKLHFMVTESIALKSGENETKQPSALWESKAIKQLTNDASE